MIGLLNVSNIINNQLKDNNILNVIMSNSEDCCDPTNGCGGVSATDTRVTARCKWFNNKAGYGFVTITGGDHDGTDVFVHHTGISVASEQYRYLVQGEYVQLNMVEMTEGEHKWQADDVRGVNGGWLMCETRNEARESRASGDDEEGEVPRRDTRGRGPRGGGSGGRGPRVQRYRVRGPGPREGASGDEIWELVRTSRHEGRGGRGQERE